MTSGILKLFVGVILLNGASTTTSPCPPDAETCRECISAHPTCAWCAEKEVSYTSRSRCTDAEHVYCEPADVVYPPAATLETTSKFNKNKMLKFSRRNIRPQRMKLMIRKGATYSFKIRVRTNKVSFKIRARYPKGVSIRIKSNCNGFHYTNRKACCKAPLRKLISMTVKIKVWRCLSKTKKISLHIEGRKRGTLKLLVDSVCSCPCEDVVEVNVTCCNGGNRTCGVCSCYPDKTCGCGEEMLDVRRCIAPGDMFPCSSRGTCVCGKCICMITQGLLMIRRYSGQFCECSDFSCDYFRGQLCGGREHGRCHCGRCICNEGYDGNDCSNQLPAESCKSSTGSICNEQGTCIDGVCHCFSPYWGPTCEDCYSCYRRCRIFENCVECLAFRTGYYFPARCRERCSKYRVHFSSDWDPHSIDNFESNKMPCIGQDRRGCLYEFIYFYTTNKTTVFVVSRKQCPNEIPALG